MSRGVDAAEAGITGGTLAHRLVGGHQVVGRDPRHRRLTVSGRNNARSPGVLVCMAALPADTTSPLTLSEQLDAMLMGWLERHAELRQPGRPDLRAKAVIRIVDAAYPEIERFCANWAMAVERASRGIAVVEGPARVVEGFTEITAMYRR
jgi:hypothetical protein